MITANPISAAPRGDAELVRESLADDREAFGQIVARYQPLICSLAYCATGNLSRSEDLAQETFVAAWQQLPELREPARLRAWLCGIARNLISNAQRRAGREPAQLAGPLDPAHEAAAAKPSPPEQAITREEEAILWRALGQIPEGYREPLVLFYREHQSVARVAAALDLSEDAVKQRLSRGRVLLQERVVAFVEGTLERSNPGRTFTLGVLAALPVLEGAIKTVAVGTAAGKGSTTAKAAAAASGGVTIFGAILAVVGLVGSWVGYQMSDSRAQSPGERVWAGRFWRLVVIGFGVFVLPAIVLAIFWGRLHPWLLPTMVRDVLCGGGGAFGDLGVAPSHATSKRRVGRDTIAVSPE
jgi:RNA polymerase sigma factor (sigma-70 family)